MDAFERDFVVDDLKVISNLLVLAAQDLLLSQGRPYWALRKLSPQPKSKPPTPTSPGLMSTGLLQPFQNRNIPRRPPTTVNLYGSKAPIASFHCEPGPTAAVVRSGDKVVLFKFWNEIKMPPSTLEKPALGLCPPLLTANGTSGYCKRISMTVDTSSALVGNTTQAGVAPALVLDQ